jgi:two-component system, response regulator PdtaR
MSLKFVVADDDWAARNVLKAAVVVDCKFKLVGEAENGVIAVELCRKLRPDVVILDVNMPPMNGDDAAKIIISEGLAKKVIMVTLSRQALPEFAKLGYGVLPKPFTDRSLLAKEILRVVSDGDCR